MYKIYSVKYETYISAYGWQSAFLIELHVSFEDHIEAIFMVARTDLEGFLLLRVNSVIVNYNTKIELSLNSVMNQNIHKGFHIQEFSAQFAPNLELCNRIGEYLLQNKKTILPFIGI